MNKNPLESLNLRSETIGMASYEELQNNLLDELAVRRKSKFMREGYFVLYSLTRMASHRDILTPNYTNFE